MRPHFVGVYSSGLLVAFGVLKYPSCVAEEDQALSSRHQLIEAIADVYLDSFSSEHADKLSTTGAQQPVSAMHFPQSSRRTYLEIVLKLIFTKSAHCAFIQQHMLPILNERAWRAFHLFYGTPAHPSHHLMGRVNRTVTILGESVLAILLATPTSDSTELGQRQGIIQAFWDDTAAMNHLNAILRRYKEVEPSVLSLWMPSDALYAEDYKDYLDNHFYVQNDASANKDALALEVRKRYNRDLGDIGGYFLFPLMENFCFSYVPHWIVGAGLRHLDYQVLGQELFPTSSTMWAYITPYYRVLWMLSKIFSTGYAANDNRVVPRVLTFLWAGYNVFSFLKKDLRYFPGLLKGISNYQAYDTALHTMASRMADIQTFVMAAKEVSEIIAASPTLEEAYGARLTHIRRLLAEARENTELGKLMHYLQTLPYSRWSYLWHNAGKLLVSHVLFMEHKDAFADAMYELGALDAFLGVAKLMQAAKNDSSSSHAYVFTQFPDRSERKKPYLVLEDMWNVLLDTKFAVGNSVVMDAAPGGPRNIILTGPNAGGKSTFLMGVGASLLLSHTLGIAPATKAVMTPFDKINTSIDIADDINVGKSLFMAEVDRAHKHINMLATLPQDKFSFSLFDEPFKGTNPTEGAAVGYSVLEAMAAYTNAMNIVVTHYPMMMLLASNCPDKGFVNYKVYLIYEGSNKKLRYTYRVIPGASNQAAAIDILTEQGYDMGLLARAREIVAHPERYHATFK